jgi:hypothetical protein
MLGRRAKRKIMSKNMTMITTTNSGSGTTTGKI